MVTTCEYHRLSIGKVIVVQLQFLIIFTIQEDYWFNFQRSTDLNSTELIYSTVVPGYLNCTRQGALAGCKIEYDKPDEQCAPGRIGNLAYWLGIYTHTN